MATSVVSICNMAMGWLGTRSIAAPTENSPEARACNKFYGPAREQTLRDHAWNFAEARVVMASIAVPAEYPEYSYAYAWPSGCLRVLKVNNASGGNEKFKIARSSDGSGRMILTNAETAVLVYTADVSDPATFDPLYVRALARRLAADACPELLKGNMRKAQEQETYYLNEIHKAQARDAGEGEGEEAEEDTWLVARYK